MYKRYKFCLSKARLVKGVFVYLSGIWLFSVLFGFFKGLHLAFFAYD